MSISKQNTLIAVFSYNMGKLLEFCVNSVQSNCAGFQLLVIDDNSDDVVTQKVLEELKAKGIRVHVNRADKDGKKHGNLYGNIRYACGVASQSGLRYLLMVQDDMQFVRPLSEAVLDEYSGVLAANDFYFQIDPRFLMRRPYEYLPETRTFRHEGLMSYADVGFLDLERLEQSGWTLREGERENGYGLRERGYLRVFPRTPIMMHVPFPARYRNGVLKRSPLIPNRGNYCFAQMSSEEIAAMDSRPDKVAPIYRDFLHPEPMGLAWLPYALLRDRKIFS